MDEHSSFTKIIIGSNRRNDRSTCSEISIENSQAFKISFRCTSSGAKKNLRKRVVRISRGADHSARSLNSLTRTRLGSSKERYCSSLFVDRVFYRLFEEGTTKIAKDISLLKGGLSDSLNNKNNELMRRRK